VALSNHLRAELERFWPAPIGLFCDLDSQISLAFLQRYPSASDARGLGEQRLQAFLKRQGYSGAQKPAQLVAKLRSAPEGRVGAIEVNARRQLVLCSSRHSRRCWRRSRRSSSRSRPRSAPTPTVRSSCRCACPQSTRQTTHTTPHLPRHPEAMGDLHPHRRHPAQTRLLRPAPRSLITTTASSSHQHTKPAQHPHVKTGPDLTLPPPRNARPDRCPRPLGSRTSGHVIGGNSPSLGSAPGRRPTGAAVPIS